MTGLDSEPTLATECVAGFFEDLERTVAEIEPHRRRPAATEERILARHGLVLAAFEGVFRAGPVAWPPSYFGEAPLSPYYPRPIMRVTDTSIATRVVLSPGWP